MKPTTARRFSQNLIFIFIIAALLRFVVPACAQDIFTDVPPDHWSRKALDKLYEGGILDSYPDKTFRGDQVVTRYEMAAALAKILERVESVELLLGGTGKKTDAGGDDTLKDLQKLLKEYEPELKSLKKMEDKIKTFEKDFQKLDKESKKDKQETKKMITDLKKDVKSQEKDIHSIYEQLNRITWSGRGTFSLSLTDYKAKDMEPLDAWGGGTCAKTTDNKGCGTPPPSVFNSSTGFELNLQASPRLSGKTDRQIKLRAEFRGLGKNLGGALTMDQLKIQLGISPTAVLSDDQNRVLQNTLNTMNNPTPTLSTFFIEYAAPRTKFTSLKLGDVSASWSILSLSILGFSYQGLKLSGILSKSLQAELVASRLRTALGNNGPSCTSVTGCKFAEYLYGLQLKTSYGNPPKFLFLHYLKNWDDKDSLFFTTDPDVNKDVQRQYQPAEISVYSAFTRYPLPPSIGFLGEIAFSNYKEYQKGLVVGTTPLDIGERQNNVPLKKESDSALLIEMDYNKRAVSVASFYFRQNPKFHNRYGGPLSLISSFGGGGLSLGGLDISKFLSGGVQGYGILQASYSPIWAKGLTIKGLPLAVFFTEVNATPLADLIVQLPKTFGTSINLTPDTDVNRRKEKLKGFFINPTIDFKPSFKTTLSLAYTYAKFEIPKHTVKGVGDLSQVTSSGKGQVSTSIKVLPPLIPASITDPSIANKPAYFYPSFQYVNKNNDTMTGVIFNDGVVRFYRNSDPTQVVLGTDIKTAGSLYDPSGNGSVPVDAANVPSLCQNDNSNCSYPTTNFPQPAEGDYVFYRTSDGTMRLLRITTKTIELAGSFASPSFKLTHQFSSKMKYELELNQQEIKVKSINIALANDPAFILGLVNGLGVKTEKTSNVNQHISYQLFNSIVLDFYYNMGFKKYLKEAGGHREQTNNFSFAVTLEF